MLLHPWQFLVSQQPTGFFSLFNLQGTLKIGQTPEILEESFQKKLKAFSTDPESFGQFRQRLSGARVCISQSQQTHTLGKSQQTDKAEIWQAGSLGCFINNVSNSAALYGENAIWNLQIFSVIFRIKYLMSCFETSVQLVPKFDQFLPVVCLNWNWVYCKSFFCSWLCSTSSQIYIKSETGQRPISK